MTRAANITLIGGLMLAATGATIWAGTALGQSLDLDGDGVSNVLEIGGYYYDASQGLTSCQPGVDEPCFVTDYQQWSTDGDPFSDFDEVSAANMPVSAPYDHPLVAAEHIIVADLVGYTVTPRTTVTDARGGSFSQSYQNETSSEYSESISVTSTASVGPGGMAGYEATGSATQTTAISHSTTRTWEVDWNTATTVDLNAAADLSLFVFVRNQGSAQARNVRLYFNLKIGNEVVASVRTPQVPGLLDLGQEYPEQEQGPWVISQAETPRGDTEPITLTMDQLKAVESGAPLTLAVTAVEAEILRWNPAGGGGGGSWSCDEGVSCDWNSYESRIKASTVKLDVHVGDERRQYRVVGGKDYANPADPDISLTLREALDLVLDVQGPNESAVIEGRPYPSDWYAMTSSDVLLQRWEDEVQPEGSLLDLRLAPGTDLRLTSPGADPAPIIDLATYAPDLRRIYVSARAGGGFPIREVVAIVTVGEEERTVQLQLGDGSFYMNAEPFLDPAAAGGRVTVTNVRGDASTRAITLPVSESASCDDIERAYALVSSGEYVLFRNGDPGKPMRAYCRFGQTAAPETYFWIDRTPSFAADSSWFMGATYVDPQTAFVVGSSGAGRSPILRTRDGGETWDSVSVRVRGIPDPAFHDVEFDDQGQTGIAVGFAYDGDTSEGYAIYRTTNGGATWIDQGSFPVLSSFPGFEQVVHVGNGTWLTGGGARFMRSVDDGVTWEAVTSDAFPWTEPNVGSIVFRDDQVGLAVLGRSQQLSGIFITRDGGDTWSLQRAFDQDFGVWYLSHVGGTTWYGGMGGTNPYVSAVYRSTDDGATWEFVADLAAYGAGQMREMEFVTPEIGYVFDTAYDVETESNYGRIWRTGDGGVTWTSERLMNGGEPRGLALLDANRGILASTNGVLMTTSGGGDPTYVVSTEDVVSAPKDEQPSLITLSQNFPNPFNPTTTITYTLEASEAVQLVVYDALGRQVRVLVDEQQPAGSHRITFDGNGLASGTYFYQVRTASGVATRKMVLMK